MSQAETRAFSITWTASLKAIVAIVVIMAGGCLDRSSGGQPAAPVSVAITFPPPNSMTNAETISVTGHVVSRDPVQGVSVNGVAATSADGFRNWSAAVSFPIGITELVAQAATVFQVTTTASVWIDRRVVFSSPVAIEIDRLGRVITLDANRVVAVDLVTRDSVTIYDGSDCSFRFAHPRSLALSPDGTRLFASDTLSGALTIDLATGGMNHSPDRLYRSFATGPSANTMLEFVSRSRRQLGRPDTLELVDLSTDQRTVLSGSGGGPPDTIGAGPRIAEARAILLDDSLQRVFVTYLSEVYSVDLASGDRAIVSTNGQGPALQRPTGLAHSVAGRLLVADAELQAIVELDPATGGRTVVSGSGQGLGPAFCSPEDLAVDARSGQAIVVDSGCQTLFSVDLASGDRTALFDPFFGQGPHLVDPVDLSRDPENGRVLLTDTGLGVVAVDLASGDRSIVSGTAVGTGPPLVEVAAIEFDPDTDTAIVVDRGSQAILRVDGMTGDRRVISGPTTGQGPELRGPRALMRGDAGSLLVGDAHIVFEVDPASGDRTEIPGSQTNCSSLAGVSDGQGGLRVIVLGSYEYVTRSGGTMYTTIQELGLPYWLTGYWAMDVVPTEGLTASPWEDQVFVNTPIGLSVADLAGQQVRLLCDAGNQGPNLSEPRGMTSENSDYVLIVDAGMRALVAFHPLTGERVIVSR